MRILSDQKSKNVDSIRHWRMVERWNLLRHRFLIGVSRNAWTMMTTLKCKPSW
jgi:hypothetical protein